MWTVYEVLKRMNLLPALVTSGGKVNWSCDLPASPPGELRRFRAVRIETGRWAWRYPIVRLSVWRHVLILLWLS